MVDGENEGIRHSFKVTTDAFAQGDVRLVNHKKYYFMVLSYGHNNFKTYDPADPSALDGQQLHLKAVESLLVEVQLVLMWYSSYSQF